MQQIQRSKKPVGRWERHSAAWGKRFGVLVLVLLTLSWSAAQSSKLSRDLQALPSSGAVNVLGQYYDQPTSTDLYVAKGLILGTNTSGQSVLWGSSVVWGSSTTTGFSVVWGTSVVWGSKTNSNAMAIAIGGDK